MTLSAGELSRMQEDVEDLMPGTAVIYSRVWTSDGRGGGSIVHNAAGTVVCRVGPATLSNLGNEMVMADRYSERDLVMVTLPATATLADTSQLEIEGVRYEVLGTDASRTDQVELRAVCSEVT